MNAMTTTPKTNTLRDQIAAYLATVEEATAKMVAAKISKADHISSVINELNAMRTEAAVECEKKKGKGNELWSWLVQRPASGSDPALLATIADVRAAIADDGRLMLNELAAKVREIFQRAQKAEAYEREARRAQAKRDDIAAENRGMQERISGYEHAIGEIHRHCADAGIAPGLVHERVAQLAAAIDLHKECAAASAEKINALTSTYDAAHAELAQIHGILLHAGDCPPIAEGDTLTVRMLKTVCRPPEGEEIERLRAELATERQARAALQEQFDAATADPAIDVKDAATAYLIRAPRRKPAIRTKPDAAVKVAMAAARNGSGRGDVYALVHVGTARRDAVYREAK